MIKFILEIKANITWESFWKKARLILAAGVAALLAVCDGRVLRVMDDALQNMP